MISRQKIYDDLREDISPQVAMKIADAINLVYMEILDTVRKDDLTNLKGIITELAEAQKRTEQRVGELAEAQKRTEQRLEELALETKELKKEVSRLDKALSELAEAQRRTEQRVEELAEAQRRTEQRVEELAGETRKEVSRLDKALSELAEAQRRTEQTLNKLIKRVDTISERQEELSNTVGYSLEDRAYYSLPKLLIKEGITVKGRLVRRYYDDNQINIFGRALRNDGTEVLIIGEAKTRPSKVEVDRFLKIVERIKIIEKTEDVLPLFVAYDYHPKTEEYIKGKGIRYFWSYEFDFLPSMVAINGFV